MWSPAWAGIGVPLIASVAAREQCAISAPGGEAARFGLGSPVRRFWRECARHARTVNDAPAAAWKVPIHQINDNRGAPAIGDASWRASRYNRALACGKCAQTRGSTSAPTRANATLSAPRQPTRHPETVPLPAFVMARIELHFPEDQYYYSTHLTVRVTDINSANHLANDSMISMISEARARFLFDAGIEEMKGEHTSIIVTDLATTYRAEAYARDQLCFEVGIMDFNKYGGDIIFRITRPTDGALIAMAKSGFVFFDYEAKKVVPMPHAFRAKFPGVNTLV
jgi:acyl-CoA thioesterase FadM